MNHDIDAFHRPLESLPITDISKEEPQAPVRKLFPHLVLLQFVSTEDDHFARVEIAESDLDKLFSEGSCSSGKEDDFVIDRHFVVFQSM